MISRFLDLQHRLAMGRFESGAKPGPNATIYRALKEDVDYLVSTDSDAFVSD